MAKESGESRVSIQEVGSGGEKKRDKEERARLTSREEGTVRPPWELERLKVRQGGRISGQAAWVSNFLRLIPSLKLDDSSSFNPGTPHCLGTGPFADWKHHHDFKQHPGHPHHLA